MNVKLSDVAIRSYYDLFFFSRCQSGSIVDHVSNLLNYLVRCRRVEVYIVLEGVPILDERLSSAFPDSPDLLPVLVCLSDCLLSCEFWDVIEKCLESIETLASF